MSKQFIHTSPLKIFICTTVVAFICIPGSFCQSKKNKHLPESIWSGSINQTPDIQPNGITELSGLHWNGTKNYLLAVADNGKCYRIMLDPTTGKVRSSATVQHLGSPEGVTQTDENANEFYTIDEKKYEIKRFSFSPDFSTCTELHKWKLARATMKNTGNSGPEGIEFIPDKYLKAAGFISSVTGQPYVSKKGMGGLIFIAHQKKGIIWVFDINPHKNKDISLVGEYKSSEKESCDLCFDQHSGLLFILHNINGNSLEVTDLHIKNHQGKYKLHCVGKYTVPNPTGGSDNIEGFAITSLSDSKPSTAWFCRDISAAEPIAEQKDCLRKFYPVSFPISHQQ